MHKRKTCTPNELSAARSRASLSRANFRGGRPRGFKRDGMHPPQTVAVDPLDAAVLRAYANERGLTLRRTVHLLAAALVLGANIPSRAHLAPPEWKYTG